MTSPIVVAERDALAAAEILAADTPSCFPSHRSFATWRLYAVASPPARHAKWCEDCLPHYQRAMCSLGMCDRPEIHFEVEDGGVIGIDLRDHEERLGGSRARAMKTRPMMTPEAEHLAAYATFWPKSEEAEPVA